MLNANTPMQCNAITIFFLIFHLYQLHPMLRTTDIIRQHYTVVKRKVFFAEYDYLICCIHCTIAFYKTIRTSTCTNYYYLLFRLMVVLNLYGRELKVWLFAFWV